MKKSKKVIRFGVSAEEELLQGFDALIETKGYANRSEAIRDLIRNRLLETQTQEDPQAEVLGTITLVYDHSHGDMANRLVDLQHRHHRLIISTLHVHIDEHDCLEVLVLRGMYSRVVQAADFLIGTRGVRHGRLVVCGGGRKDRISPHPHPAPHAP